MRRQFTVNTEPHVAEVGGVELLFQPEVYGAEFLEHYEELKAAQAAAGVDLSDLESVDTAKVLGVTTALRVFLARLMMPESAKAFARWHVVIGGKKVADFGHPDDAAADAKKRKGAATIRDASMRLPDRVLVELVEWTNELYGGSRPSGSSTDSAPASPSPGPRGKEALRSRASTRARGR